MVFDYKTIAKPTEGFYKEKGSKFIAKAYPISSLDGINEILLALRKEFHDARHHCYAYRLNPEADLFRANDDGEPNHSAGDPILGQIKSFELTNVLIVVIRYFGGSKLGVSGLINAYKTAAALALEQAKIIQREVLIAVSFKFNYPDTNEIMKLIDRYGVKIEKQEYLTSCIITGSLPVKFKDSLKSDLELLNNLGVAVTIIL